MRPPTSTPSLPPDPPRDALGGATPSARRRGWMLGLLAFAMLYPSPHHKELNNPNENVRFYMTAAIAEMGTYRIDSLRKRWGWVNDAAVYKGHVFSVKAPGTSLLGVPVYAALHYGSQLLGWKIHRDTLLWFCRVLGNILPILLLLHFLYPWWARRLRSPLVRDASYLSMTLGSLLYGYSLIFVSHTLAALVGLGAFALLDRARDNRERLPAQIPVLAGLGTAGVTFFEYPGVVLSVVLFIWGVWVLRNPRAIALFCLGAAIPTLAVMHFQWAAFDNPFMPGHLYVENPAFRALHQRGLFGADSFHPDAAWRLLFDPGFGLFALTPMLLAGIPGLLVALKSPRLRGPAITALFIVTLTWLAASSLSNWRGGWTIGPRYLAWSLPFWAWGAALSLDALWRRWPHTASALAIGSLGTSFLASGLPSAWYPHLPEALTRPLPQLFVPALLGGFTPRTLLSPLGLNGAIAALPLFVLGAIAILWTATADLDRNKNLTYWTKRMTLRLGSAAIVTALLLVPLMREPQADNPSARTRADGATAFVLNHWSPAGRDRASLLQASMTAGRATPGAWRELTQLYAQQRRWKRARSALRHLPAAEAAALSQSWPR